MKKTIKALNTIQALSEFAMHILPGEYKDYDLIKKIEKIARKALKKHAKKKVKTYIFDGMYAIAGEKLSPGDEVTLDETNGLFYKRMPDQPRYGVAMEAASRNGVSFDFKVCPK